jgi:hypothetical protein
MNLRKLALVAVLSATCGGAMATVVVSSVGPTTTYTENFDAGSSFSAGWLNVPFSSDDYMALHVLAPSSSYTFSSAVSLASLSLSFWYSVPGNGNGTVSIAGSGPTALGDTPGNAVQYLLNNPGSSTGGLGGTFDAQFSTTLNNVAAGSYTVTFATAGGLLNSLKVDDVLISAVAAPIPEPETYALMLGGLGMLGWMARRRQQGSASH